MEVSLLMSPPLGRRQREAKQKSWRLRMKKEASTRNESVRAHGEEGWCESRCDVKKTRQGLER